MSKTKQPKTRTMWIWDDEVAECFDLRAGKEHLIDGKLCARYFEAIRYRQQLTPRKSFAFKSTAIKDISGLSYKQQLKAKKVLEGSGWIETDRIRKGKGTVLTFLVTKLARDAIGHIAHPQDTELTMRNLRAGAYHNGEK